MSTCYYCSNYKKGKPVYGTDKNSKLIGRRCVMQNMKIVDRDSSSCDEFSASPFFTCLNNDHMIKALVCKARREKGADDCKDCIQKYEIDRTYKLMPDSDKPRSLPKRQTQPETKPDPKPKRQLIRRKVGVG